MQLPDGESLVATLAEKIAPTLTPNTAIVGIHTGGAWVARKLWERLGGTMPFGTLDISFYRDDFSRIGLHPQSEPSEMPFEVEDSSILLVDDVLYTGRTIRAAMTDLFDYGRPARIDLAVLVERQGRELPICARFVGAVIDTDANIQVNLDSAGKLVLSLHPPSAGQ